MQSSKSLTYFLILFSHFVGFALSLLSQHQRQLFIKNSRSFPIAANDDDRHPLMVHRRQLSQSTCLFGTRREKQWNSKYQELAEFYKEHGHFGVEMGGNLHNWMKTQRHKRECKGSAAPLTDNQIKLLEEIDFPWDPKTSRPMGRKAAKWFHRYEELAEFYKKHGHFRVEYQGTLDNWMMTQRKKREGSGRFTPLTDEQIQLLEEIDFPWDPEKGTGRLDAKWRTKYEELAEFYKKHGHIRVEYQGTLDNWMMTQRKKREGSGGLTPLTDEQIQLLEEIDFPWDPEKGTGRHDAKWRTKYEELAEFYKKHGHCKVEYQGRLYQWMISQRLKRRGYGNHAPLTDEQVQLLDEIAFPWEYQQGRPAGKKNAKWMNKYDELAEFYRQNGHLKVKSPSSLYQWMVIQRRKRKGILNGYAPLTNEQIQLLDGLDFDWNPNESRRRQGGPSKVRSLHHQ